MGNVLLAGIFIEKLGKVEKNSSSTGTGTGVLPVRVPLCMCR